MNPLLSSVLPALMITLAAPAQATAVLYEQAPLQQPDALASGSDGQAPLLAETFSFSGTASAVSWWGTPGEGFDISLTAGAGSGPSFSARSVAFQAAGFTVEVDIDGDLQADTVDVYRYSIDLGALPAGTYTLAVRETSTDALGLSWFWLHGAPGDGVSLSGLGERDLQRNAFDLSLRVDGERGGSVPEPGSLLLVAAALGLLSARHRARAV